MLAKIKIIENEKGLSLIELLATLIILAIITAIAIPTISAVINNSRDKAIISDITSLVNTAEIAIIEGGCGNDSVCTYSDSNNEIGFKSSMFTEGKVDFTGGKSDSQIKITVNIPSNALKGRNAKEFADTVADNKVFTKKQLLDLLEN